MKFLFSILCMVFILTGCSQDNIDKVNKFLNEKFMAEVDKRIIDLWAQLSSTERNLERRINKIEAELPASKNSKVAIFNPSQKGYVVIHSNVGYFLVSLEKITKYANGYKVIFNIGNPNMMAFEGMKVKVTWGKAKESATHQSVEEWINSMKVQEVAIKKTLLPGYWNKVSVVLSPATAEETGVIGISLETDQILLKQDYRKETD